jgi:hypothetical protein
LNAQEQREVREARYHRNLQGCLDGIGHCDTLQLSDTDRLGVARAAYDRNLLDCLNGSESCDRSQLGIKEQHQSTGATVDGANVR